MEPVVYILENLATGKRYIGSSTDIKRRYQQHLKGYTRTTRLLKTHTLVYLKRFNLIEEARGEEKRLKKAKNKKYINWLIENKNDMVVVAQR